MSEFAVGTTVQVTGPVMTGSVGTVTHHDQKREKYLVVFTHISQYYFGADEITVFSP